MLIFGAKNSRNVVLSDSSFLTKCNFCLESLEIIPDDHDINFVLFDIQG